VNTAATQKSRSAVALVIVALVSVRGTAGEPSSPRTGAALRVSAVGAIGMTVSNMEGAIDFYTHVLPFEPIADVEQSGR